MASKTVNPTRMELTKLKGKLKTATRGHKLLKDKRDGLMKEFLDLVRRNKELRENVEEKIKKSNAKFAVSAATMSDKALKTAIMAPKQEVYLKVDSRNVMSVDIPKFNTTTKSVNTDDIYAYGYAFTSMQLDDSVKELSEVLPALLELAEAEKATQLMASEIEKTRRRVNALEYVLIPDMQIKIKYIQMKLDENERSTQIRLMKVKDMVLEDAHHYKEK